MFEKLLQTIGTKRGGLKEQEMEGIISTMECLKHGGKAVAEKIAFSNLPLADRNEKNLGELVRAWIRYRRAVDNHGAAPKSMLVSATVDSFLSPADPGILEPWAAICDSIAKNVQTQEMATLGTMEPAANWKADLSEASVEAVVAKADNTVMAVKGKKLTVQKEALEKAGVTLWLCCGGCSSRLSLAFQK